MVAERGWSLAAAVAGDVFELDAACSAATTAASMANVDEDDEDDVDADDDDDVPSATAGAERAEMEDAVEEDADDVAGAAPKGDCWLKKAAKMAGVFGAEAMAGLFWRRESRKGLCSTEANCMWVVSMSDVTVHLSCYMYPGAASPTP